MPTSPELIQLYAEMSALTAPECDSACRVPHSCCASEYCELAIQWAKEGYGIDLPRVNGEKANGEVLPLMGANGCTAAPHYRPICTVHTCAISGMGCKQGDPTWTKKYFKLRDKIDSLEFKAAGVL